MVRRRHRREWKQIYHSLLRQTHLMGLTKPNLRVLRDCADFTLRDRHLAEYNQQYQQEKEVLGVA